MEEKTPAELFEEAKSLSEEEKKFLANISENNNFVDVALDDVRDKIINNAKTQINDEHLIDKHSKKLAENADKSIEVELDRQNLQIQKNDADNKVTKKEIENRLYELKQEAIRIKKHQKHLNKLQKQEHRKEKSHIYWETYKDTLTLYKMREGSNRFFCNVLICLDGIKGFFNGLSAVSTALVKSLKWLLLLGIGLGVIMAIPVSRNWFLTLLGFIK